MWAERPEVELWTELSRLVPRRTVTNCRQDLGPRHDEKAMGLSRGESWSSEEEADEDEDQEYVSRYPDEAVT